MNRKLSTLCCILALLALNVWISARLFRTEFTQFLDSTEGLYITLARWFQHHWAHPGWFPLWYGGIPIENAYPPVFPHLAALVSFASGMSAAHSVQAVRAAFYCLGPVALFALTRRLTQSPWKALAAGWLYSLVSLSSFLLPWVREDTPNYGPVRVFALLKHDEGAHIAATAILLAALAAIHAAIEHAPGWRTILAALLSTGVVLTNWLGGIALVCGVLALLAVRKREEHKRPAGSHIVLIGVLAYAVAAPWIPPSVLAAVYRNAQGLSGNYPMGRPQYFYLVAWVAVAFAIGLLMKNWTSVPEAGRFAAVFFFFMAVPPLGMEWFKIYPLPQSNRYALEMDAAFAMAAGIVLGSLRLGSKRTWSRVVTGVALAALALILAPRFRKQIRAALPPFDITKTVEYERAVYLNSHYPGQRVFVDGSTRYWFNAFADNPQLGGVADQGRSNPAIAQMTYAIPNASGNGRDTVALLKACGIRAIAVSGPHTREIYRYRDAAKFAGIVSEVWREGDDAIYEIPGSGSLAHVVGKDVLVTTEASDYPALVRYAAAIDADPRTRLLWSGPNRAIIEANVVRPQVISVQISYDPGWRATVNGTALKPQKDALGFLVLEPECHGDCRVELSYGGGTQRRVMDAFCGLGLAGCAAIVILGIRRRGA